MATLVIGLPDESRLKKKLSNKTITLDQELMAIIIDLMSSFMWGRSGRKGAKPPSIYKTLTQDNKDKDELESFDSPEEYEAWRASKEEQWKCQK